jgi:hypothetical protein
MPLGTANDTKNMKLSPLLLGFEFVGAKLSFTACAEPRIEGKPSSQFVRFVCFVV